MRDIVATIQAEQDEAIRAPYQGFTMITGGPGTGKTVVALHRAAYLLYSNRRRSSPAACWWSARATAFMNYIEQVLPSLGEESVTLQPIGRVAADVVAVTGDGWTHRHRGGQRQPADGEAAASAGVRATAGRPEELRVSVKGHVLVLPGQVLNEIRAEVLAHHKVNLGPGSRGGGAERAVAGPPVDLEQDRDEFDELVTARNFERLLAAWWRRHRDRVLTRLADSDLLHRLSGRTAVQRGVRT